MSEAPSRWLPPMCLHPWRAPYALGLNGDDTAHRCGLAKGHHSEHRCGACPATVAA